MSLTSGTYVGSYQIVGALGEGGMGEVYRAHDARLHRDVAIKVLSEALAADEERLARLEREARVLAALNHPNIAQIYGIEQRALVMELVEGEDLAQRIARGPVPSRDALPILHQIAEALDAAHEQGIVHRDLKPANVRVRPDGIVKVLDFGIARTSGSAASIHVDTMTATPTITGTLVGTVAYMSPEQARGFPADRRSDIWSFGCLAYEMLTGRRTFTGATTSDVLAAVLEREPDWSTVSLTSFERTLLTRCLQKDPRRRYHDAGDIAHAIDDALAGPAPSPSTTRRASLVGATVLVIGALAAGAAGDHLIARRTTSPTRGISRIAVPLPADAPLGVNACPMIAISPDGTQVAFIAMRNGRLQLFVRGLNEFDAHPVRGGEDATDTPLFSPDGQWIAFYAGGQIRKVPVSGGAATALASSQACGGDWPTADRIFIGNRFGIVELPAGGGDARVFIRVDYDRGEASLDGPHLIADHNVMLMTLFAHGTVQLVAQRLDTDERAVIVPDGWNGAYVNGYVVYSSGGTIFRVRFDPATLKVSGIPEPIVDGLVQYDGALTPLSVARLTGGMAVIPGGLLSLGTRSIVALDSSGAASAFPVPPGRYSALRVSPDGRRIALTRSAGSKNNIWIYDIERTTLTPLTTEYDNRSPAWSADGKSIFYASDATGFGNLRMKKADGSGAEDRLTTAKLYQQPTSTSADGKWLVFDQFENGLHHALWAMPLNGDRNPRLLVSAPGSATFGVVSPNGHWLAYVADFTGREEVYVQPFPDGGVRTQISSEGGRYPAWRGHGEQLLYRDGSKVMAVDIRASTELHASRPRLLFDDHGATEGALAILGERLLALSRPKPVPPITRLNVLLDWNR